MCLEQGIEKTVEQASCNGEVFVNVKRALCGNLMAFFFFFLISLCGLTNRLSVSRFNVAHLKELRLKRLLNCDSCRVLLGLILLQISKLDYQGWKLFINRYTSDNHS